MTPVPRVARLFDRLLVGLAFLLAVLVASFIARNSDVWLHLASGRLVAAGTYDFATDPFSYATDGVRWVNHSWLSDLAVYHVFTRLGGGWLVGAKAVLVGVTVLAAGSGAKRTHGRWAVAVLAAVAASALAPRATLQPFVISMFLFAVLLRLLQAGGRAYFAVPVLSILWSNLDDWYVLGPAITLLHWAGCRWKKTTPVPHWLPAAGIAACLLTPFHVFGFTLPTEVSPSFWGSEFARDPRIAPQFASPFSNPPLDAVSFWAFVVLLVGGGAVLAVRRKEITMWETALWLLLAALGVWQARLIPLFSVGTLVVFTPHLQALADRLERRRVRWLVRAVAFFTLLALGATAWTGWLNGVRGRDRDFGWSVAVPGWAESGGKMLGEWRQRDILTPDGRILALSPEATNVLYWFAPGERGHLDTRWELHTRAGTRLLSADQLGLGANQTPDAELLARHRVEVVFISQPSLPLLTRVLAPGCPWRLHAVVGPTVLLVPPDEWWGTFDPASRLRFDSTPPTPSGLPTYPAWWAPPQSPRSDAGGAATLTNLFLAGGGESLPMALAALREARRDTLTSGDDPRAWFELGRASAAVAAAEARLAPQNGLFAELRRVQRTTALQQAVIAQPDHEAAHAGLAAVLTETGYVDRALAERRKELALARRRGDAERTAAVAAEVTRLEDVVFDRECLLQVRVPRSKLSSDPLPSARAALDLGLVDFAQEVLLKSSPDLYGADGVRLLAWLLVSTGQAGEAAALLDRKELRRGPNALGFHEVGVVGGGGERYVYRLPAYHWFQFLLAASTGQSDPADPLRRIRDELTFTLTGLDAQVRQSAPSLARDLVVPTVGLGATGTPLVRALGEATLQRPTYEAKQFRTLYAQRGDLLVLGAAWAVESGTPSAAKGLLEEALADYEQGKGAGLAPAKPLAEAYQKVLGGK